MTSNAIGVPTINKQINMIERYMHEISMKKLAKTSPFMYGFHRDEAARTESPFETRSGLPA
jgi:hypothetical protein